MLDLLMLSALVYIASKSGKKKRKKTVSFVQARSD